MPILPLITKHSDRVKHFGLMLRSFFSHGPHRHKYHFEWPKRASYSSDAQCNGSSSYEGEETATKDRLPLRDRDSSIDPLSLVGGDSRDSHIGC